MSKASGYFGVLFYTTHDCPYCHKAVPQGARHWCATFDPAPFPCLTNILCTQCDTLFHQENGHSCRPTPPHIPGITWHQKVDGTVEFGPLADAPKPSIWGVTPIPVPVSVKVRLQRQIKRLREVYLSDDVGQLSEIIPVLDDLVLDL